MNLPPRWRCELCNRADDDSKMNVWSVDVDGEIGLPDDNEVGEFAEALSHEITVCDRCTHREDFIASLLAQALAVERASKRCTVCQSKREDSGACPLCDQDDA